MACCSQTARQPSLLEFEISGDDAGIVLDAAAKSFDLNSEFEPTSMSHGCVCRGVRGPSRLTSQ